MQHYIGIVHFLTKI